MVKMVYILSFFFLISCKNMAYYKLPRDLNGNPVATDDMYSLKKNYDFSKIDTLGVYRTFEKYSYDWSAKEIFLEFKNNGYFIQYSNLSKHIKDSMSKKHVYRGGKYFINDDTILLEEFLPSEGGKTNYYIRQIKKGKIIGETIIFRNELGDIIYTKD